MSSSSDTNTATTTSSTPLSNSLSPSPSSSPPRVILSPCAACKILRRRCADKCVLAPYFPPTEPAKFTIAHRIFGASNIIKLLQELPEYQRADAISSMVYEASARIRDPVYGSVGAVCQLQKQVNELQAQLAKAQAQLLNMQCQQQNLVAFICKEFNAVQSDDPQTSPTDDHDPSPDTFIAAPHDSFLGNPSCFFDDNTNLGSFWETSLDIDYN